MDQGAVVEGYFASITEASKKNLQEAEAAGKLQRYYRGHVVRHEALRRKKAALRIQAVARLYIACKRVRRVAIERKKARLKAYYDAVATQIQRIYRGFRSRKYRHNYYTRKKYLEEIAQAGEDMRTILDEHGRKSMEHAVLEQRRTLVERYSRAASKSHHLLGTNCVPGVFNSPYAPPPLSPEGDLVEDSLRDTFARSYHEGSLSLETHRRMASMRAARRTMGPKMPQPPGPFKPRDAVLRQRARPITETIRRAGPYTADKEAAAEDRLLNKLLRVGSGDFYYATRKHPVARSYVTSINHGLPFQDAIKMSRTADPTKQMGDVPFRSAVHTVEYFDNATELYNNRVV